MAIKFELIMDRYKTQLENDHIIKKKGNLTRRTAPRFLLCALVED